MSIRAGVQGHRVIRKRFLGVAYKAEDTRLHRVVALVPPLSFPAPAVIIFAYPLRPASGTGCRSSASRGWEVLIGGAGLSAADNT